VRDKASAVLTLEDHIASKRAQLVRERGEADDLVRRARALREEADGMLGVRWQRRRARDLIVRADALEEEARKRATMEREHDFETSVVSYLRTYHGAADVVRAAATTPHGASSASSSSSSSSSVMPIAAAVASSTAARAAEDAVRSTVLDEYLTEMNEAPAKVAMAARETCPRCADGPKLLLCASRALMTCPTCGYAVTYVDATSSCTAFDEIVEFSQYSYKRVNHYSMHLTLVQGKEAHQVPDTLLDAVMRDLYDRQRVRSVDEITAKRVREALRKQRLRKGYDHVAQITARLTGKRAPRIPRHVEDQLKTLFLTFLPAFQRHAPESRSNFLSYSYVLYRSFQILGLHHMLDSITLLKGRDKLEANDAIFRSMCEDLGLPVFDLPPATETMGG
jgi:hypothetical protein